MRQTRCRKDSSDNARRALPMMSNCGSWSLLQVGVLCVLWCNISVSYASATYIDITLDPDFSVLNVTGRFLGLNPPATLVAQGPGSTTTRYQGTITVNVDDLFEPSEIEFVSGSIVADNSGDWLPAGGGGTLNDPGLAEPANYGLLLDGGLALTAWVTLRDTVFSPSSTPLPVVFQQFSSKQLIEVTSGAIDFNIISPFFGDSVGSDSQVGLTATNKSSASGEYVVDGIVARLTLPIDIVFLDQDREVALAGTLVGFATIVFPTGDFDEDDDVDGDDFLIWQRGESPSPLSASDLALWEEQFGTTSALSLSTTVPEPSCIILWLAAFACSLPGRRT